MWKAPAKSDMIVCILIVLYAMADSAFSFPVAMSSARHNTCLWLADEGKGAEGGTAINESDRLLSEIAELTESFEYVQKKNERNKLLYKEKIATLQSEISELKAELSSSSRASSSEAPVHNATVAASVEEDFSKMRIEWEEEKRALLDEKEALAQSIAALKESIQSEAESMRSDVKGEGGKRRKVGFRAFLKKRLKNIFRRGQNG